MSRRLEVASDPRTIARNVSGIFDATFPQLAPAIVAHFNRTYGRGIPGMLPISSEILEKSTLQRAMLFELALAVAEEQLSNLGHINWEQCLSRAGARQRRFFDAEIPVALNAADCVAAEKVAMNLLAGLKEISGKEGQPVVSSPKVPGFRWIATGEGDFATERTIIEVKCSSKRFSTADYRQIIIYWLLKHIHSLQFGGATWRNGVLINPRLNLLVEFSFKDLVELIALEKSVSSIVDVFCTIVTGSVQGDSSDIQYELNSWPNG